MVADKLKKIAEEIEKLEKEYNSINLKALEELKPSIEKELYDQEIDMFYSEEVLFLYLNKNASQKIINLLSDFTDSINFIFDYCEVVISKKNSEVYLSIQYDHYKKCISQYNLKFSDKCVDICQDKIFYLVNKIDLFSFLLERKI